MDYAKEALRLHKEWQGQLETVAKMKIETRDDLSLAYTPGVAVPCLEIEKDKSQSYVYTGRGHTIAVISDGSAVLGLGNMVQKRVCRLSKENVFCSKLLEDLMRFRYA